jgi:hypothetical protein
MCCPPVNQHTGTLVEDVVAIVDRALSRPPAVPEPGAVHAEVSWHEVYFFSGELLIEPWEIIVRVRNAIVRGAADDGQMSWGAVDAWYDLGELQTELMMKE